MPSSRAVSLSVAALVVIALVASGFAFVDAGVVQSEAATSSGVSTARVDNSTASLADPVTLYVPGDGWLETAVADHLERALTERGATVTRVDSLEGPTKTPVLVVTVTDADVSYTPVAPSATVETSFAYVKSGNATLARGLAAGELLTVHGTADAYVAYGDVTVRDRTRGVATWPAYQRRVSTVTANATLQAIAGAAEMDQPK